MPKNEKDAFDSFQELLIDTFDLCQFWDKRGGFRNKTVTIYSIIDYLHSVIF